MKLIFDIDIYKVYSESLKTKAVFIKTEMNNEWNINFPPNSSVGL